MSTGIARLDSMLGEGGLLQGQHGAGHAARPAPASRPSPRSSATPTCRRGERAIYFAFEESAADIVRNMASVGIDLQPWVDDGLLTFHCFRPSLLGLEAHLLAMQDLVDDFDPAVVVKDPVSDLLRVGNDAEVSALLTRQVDFLKGRGVTALFTTPEPRDDSRRRRPAPRVARRHLAAPEDDGGQRRAQPRALRPQVPRDGPLEPDPGVPPHLDGIELADVYVGPARRPHRLGPPGPGGEGAGRRDSPQGRPRPAARSSWTGSGPVGRGPDRRPLARLRDRGSGGRPPARRRIDRLGRPGQPAGRAGPAAPGRHADCARRERGERR